MATRRCAYCGAVVVLHQQEWIDAEGRSICKGMTSTHNVNRILNRDWENKR